MQHECDAFLRRDRLEVMVEPLDLASRIHARLRDVEKCARVDAVFEIGELPAPAMRRAPQSLLRDADRDAREPRAYLSFSAEPRKSVNRSQERTLKQVFHFERRSCDSTQQPFQVRRVSQKHSLQCAAISLPTRLDLVELLRREFGRQVDDATHRSELWKLACAG